MIAADVEELVIIYLGQTFTNVGVDMPPNPPMPFYLVTGIPAKSSHITECDVVQVEAFAASRTGASTAGRNLHKVMNPWAFTAKLGFTMSTGSRANIDSLEILEKPSYRPYEDPNLYRYCGRYRIELRMNQSS